jgi:hypothetical protein
MPLCALVESDVTCGNFTFVATRALIATPQEDWPSPRRRLTRATLSERPRREGRLWGAVASGSFWLVA